ncbi:hypothetical protein [Horticoccus sp. 23ND18S-11]|uniref:hypothetical protein n=1 Tax=Horticoccus sp. 23ND18S-11 TaxID=3391832 RepID=UPI0039C8C107
MKLRAIIAAASVAVLLVLSGCASALIGSASTKIEASAPTGEKLSLTLPKEYEATNLVIFYDPATKTFKLSADNLHASSQGLLQSATQAQADATSKAVGLADKLASALTAPKP